MTQFKVGDRVVGIGTQDERVIDGKRGTVKQIDSLYAAVQFDDNIGGWGDSKLGIPRGHGLFVIFNKLSRLSAGRTIVITHKDGITTARLLDGKKTIKSAEAKCAPGDAFDFTAGANLAFDRLMGREKAVEPEGWYGEAICTADGSGFTADGSGFTVGKKYTFINGVVRDDNGDYRPCGGNEHVQSTSENWFANKFIEYRGEA